MCVCVCGRMIRFAFDWHNFDHDKDLHLEMLLNIRDFNSDLGAPYDSVPLDCDLHYNCCRWIDRIKLQSNFIQYNNEYSIFLLIHLRWFAYYSFKIRESLHFFILFFSRKIPAFALSKYYLLLFAIIVHLF